MLYDPTAHNQMWRKKQLLQQRFQQAMIGEDPQLVADESVDFEK